jgi:hypothetical protein
MIRDEMQSIWQQAAQIAYDANATVKDLQDAASWLIMLIEKADEPFPEVHSLLAYVASRLNDDDFAEKHADIALRYSPNDFNSQSIKVQLAAKKLNLTDMFDVVKVAGSSSDDTVAALTLLGGILGQKNVSNSQNVFTSEVEKLLSVFRNLAITPGYSCEDYAYQASIIAMYADVISSDTRTSFKFSQLLTKMYQTIGSVNPKELPCQDSNSLNEAYKIYLSAQGRLKRKLEYQAEKQKSSDKCFVATAVYSPKEMTKVDVLRKYRDEVLIQSIVGRVFVAFYYTVSPGIARVIAKSQILKSTIRVLLEPIVKAAANFTQQQKERNNG